MDIIDMTIDNLEKLSEVLDRKSGEPHTYNTDWGYYLGQMAFDLYKDAQMLKERKYMFGSVL